MNIDYKKLLKNVTRGKILDREIPIIKEIIWDKDIVLESVKWNDGKLVFSANGDSNDYNYSVIIGNFADEGYYHGLNASCIRDDNNFYAYYRVHNQNLFSYSSVEKISDGLYFNYINSYHDNASYHTKFFDQDAAKYIMNNCKSLPEMLAFIENCFLLPDDEGVCEIKLTSPKDMQVVMENCLPYADEINDINNNNDSDSVHLGLLRK